jgi:hypothetical protein
LARLLEDFKFYPYKLQVVHELRNTDKQSRRTAFFNIHATMIRELLFLQHLLMSDEANLFFLDM